MPVYEYRCQNGHTESHWFHVDDRNRPLGLQCFSCTAPMHRVFSFSPARIMHSHFNHSLGRPISSMRQFKDELARSNEALSLRNGIPHNAEAMMPGDLPPPES